MIGKEHWTCCCSLSRVWRALYLRARQSPLIPWLRCGPNNSSSDFLGTYVLWRLEMEPVPQIAGNIVQNSVNFVLIQFASSSGAAVSYFRLAEAGFDSSRLGLGASSTPRTEESLVSQDVG